MVGKQGRLCLEREKQFAVENTTNYIEPGKKKPLKNRMITIRGLGIPAVKWEFHRLLTHSFTNKGMPQCNAETIKELAGSINTEDLAKSRFGRAFNVILGERSDV